MGRKRTIDDGYLLDVARECFRRGGNDTPTRSIAAQAGVSDAFIYQRFGSKDAFFFAAMTPDPVDVERVLGPRLTPEMYHEPRQVRDYLAYTLHELTSYFERVLPMIWQVLGHPCRDEKVWSAWRRALPFEPLAAELEIRLQRLIARGLLSSRDPRRLAECIVAIAQTSVMVDRFEMSRNLYLTRDAAFADLWEGIAPRRPASSPGLRSR